MNRFITIGATDWRIEPDTMPYRYEMRRNVHAMTGRCRAEYVTHMRVIDPIYTNIDGLRIVSWHQSSLMNGYYGEFAECVADYERRAKEPFNYVGDFSPQLRTESDSWHEAVDDRFKLLWHIPHDKVVAARQALSEIQARLVVDPNKAGMIIVMDPSTWGVDVEWNRERISQVTKSSINAQ